MKTKFLQLLKIKEQKLKNIELRLYHVQNLKFNILKEIEDIVHDIKKLELPKNGNFAKIGIVYSNKKYLMQQKEIKKQELIVLENKIVQIKDQYKKASIDYERIKYLHNMEIKKIIHKIKEQEQKEMDEIANLLFTNKNIGSHL